MRFESPYADLFKKKKKKKKKPVHGVRARFEIALDSIVDQDILERLEKETNKSDYVRKLIRNDIKKRG